jgi:hypothetical protein
MTLKDETSLSQSLFGSGSGHDMVMMEQLFTLIQDIPLLQAIYWWGLL